LKIGYSKSEKIIIESLESDKTGSLESEKSGPYRSIPRTSHFPLKKTWSIPNFNVS